MKHIEFILLLVSFLRGEEFQGREECAEAVIAVIGPLCGFL